MGFKNLTKYVLLVCSSGSIPRLSLVWHSLCGGVLLRRVSVSENDCKVPVPDVPVPNLYKIFTVCLVFARCMDLF